MIRLFDKVFNSSKLLHLQQVSQGGQPGMASRADPLTNPGNS